MSRNLRTPLFLAALAALTILSVPLGQKALATDKAPPATVRDVVGSGRPAFTGADGLNVQEAVPIPKDATDDRRRQRNYPEQPPVIPHTIVGYQLDMKVNKCLTCHAREFTGDSQAPMVSVTHFQDRDGQVLAGVSTRRYFCLQCHVPQSDVQPRVPNIFRDMDSMSTRPAGAK
ncbi:nitrate reductase cytochrome c-type subunit [Niveispirillum sp. KHB5.9]|uniref:nitrate reductase cytochrome c-type subunit n=1 Tax=Niveispirillum sp. KHB5.9 TaxID=3400269 RepID=UPI003A8B5740